MNKPGLKNILLVHPLGYSSDKASGDISRVANITPPIGLASISAYLAQNDIQSDIIDCYAHPDSDKKYQIYIKSLNPKIIGFSCSTSTFLDGIRLSGIAKAIDPEIKTVFGGAHVSALKESIIEKFSEIDYLVIGEGEQTLTELILSGFKNVSEIQNIVYRNESKKAVFTGYRKKLLDLDSLPFPAYEKLEGYPHKYKLPIFNYPTTPSSSCISSRGCPYSCSYCDRSVFKKSFRYNSALYLYNHIKYLNTRLFDQKYFFLQHF